MLAIKKVLEFFGLNKTLQACKQDFNKIHINFFYFGHEFDFLPDCLVQDSGKNIFG
jgi:hypothetical protein